MVFHFPHLIPWLLDSLFHLPVNFSLSLAQMSGVAQAVPRQCLRMLSFSGPPAPPSAHYFFFGSYRRVVLVDYRGQTVFDSYVVPTNDITDFRTSTTGLLPEHLATGERHQRAVVALY